MLFMIDGGCSSVGRAPDCDSGRRGFKSHHPPQLIFWKIPLPSKSEAEPAIEVEAAQPSRDRDRSQKFTEEHQASDFGRRLKLLP